MSSIHLIAFTGKPQTCAQTGCKEAASFYFPGLARIPGTSTCLCEEHAQSVAQECTLYPLVVESGEGAAIVANTKTKKTKAAKAKSSKTKTVSPAKAKYLKRMETWKEVQVENQEKELEGSVIMGPYAYNGKRVVPVKEGYMSVDIGGVYYMSPWKSLNPSYINPYTYEGDVELFTEEQREFKNYLNWVFSCEVLAGDLCFPDGEIPTELSDQALLEQVREHVVEVERPREDLLRFKESTLPCKRRASREDPVLFYETDGEIFSAMEFRQRICRQLDNYLEEDPLGKYTELYKLKSEGANLNIIGYAGTRLSKKGPLEGEALDEAIQNLYEDTGASFLMEAVLLTKLSGARKPWM